ncbi:MAG: lysine N(6)-hydroxylase/L-ornithine N(5)-oxygenase family protein [Saccharothrix sp.]|nr:lysine N(6)-hydroxylase/L-ornithine N(5)-oxygenase family protein [Saccharothrix sp.]
MTPAAQGDARHDVVGVGFGPANLALAVALDEHPGPGLDVRFLDRKPRFGWHRDMLIEGATMQVSFLKDLVTPRNATSPFGFLSYLQEKGRLAAFVNQQDFFPTRVEFHDYLEWAAARFTGVVTYGADVVDVRPVVEDGVVTALEVVADVAGSRQRSLTRDLVLAPGLRPVMADGLAPDERVWHSSELLARLAALDGREPGAFVVVGGGQSGAEVVAHLHERFPDAQVHSVISRYGYQPADDTPFVNEIFDHEAVDLFHDAPPEVKRQVLAQHRNTNYGVVDQELIKDLYRRRYREDVTGRRRLHLWRMARVCEVRPAGSRLRVAVESALTGRSAALRADVVVCATGYRPVEPLSLLGGLARWCETDPSGAVRVGRDYRVATAPNVRPAVFVQGATEHSHGLSSSLLSNVAVRAGEIARSLARRATSASAA